MQANLQGQMQDIPERYDSPGAGRAKKVAQNQKETADLTVHIRQVRRLLEQFGVIGSAVDNAINVHCAVNDLVNSDIRSGKDQLPVSGCC